MKLSSTDIAYIDTRLDDYDLKYQEVYDELKDHVLLATESARINGDDRDIEFIYNEMMSNQFPGYYAFEKIAIAYEKAYRIKIKKKVWANFRYYLSPLNILVIVLALIAGYYYLPDNNTTFLVLFTVSLITSATPVIYASVKIAKIRTEDGRKSIVREYIINHAALLIFNYYIIVTVFHFLTDNWEAKPFNPRDHDPTVNLFVITFIIIYGLSIARLCRQEIKSPDLNINQQ